MAVEVIDGPLRAEGEEVRASRAPRGELRLGPYAIRSIVQKSHSTRKGEALLADVGSRPSTLYNLDFELAEADASEDRTWRASCVAERRIADNIDFADAADEAHDDVALMCTLQGADSSEWSLRALGDVGHGLSGEVHASDPHALAFNVEILARRRFFGAVARELPFPVVQLREGRVATAAMLLDAPERAWFGPDLADDRRELALTVMVALRLLPLGETAYGR